MFRFQEINEINSQNPAEKYISQNPADEDKLKISDIDDFILNNNKKTTTNTYILSASERVDFCKRYSHKMIISDDFSKSLNRAILFTLDIFKANLNKIFEVQDDDSSNSDTKLKNIIFVFDSTGFTDRLIVTAFIKFLILISGSKDPLD